MNNRLLIFKNKPKIVSTSTICGPKEAKGNLGCYVDKRIEDDYAKQKSFEAAEREMILYVVKHAVKKSTLKDEQIGAYIGGDLLNQIISSSFAARQFVFPFLGVYTACATMAESMLLGAVLIDGGYLDHVVCATGSHFSTAERQYRYPLEQGTTRPAQSQWTVTGAGANVISLNGRGPKIRSALIGRVVDLGVTDTNNMGAAMAPAVVDSLYDFFISSKSSPSDYDLILTGDLGSLGTRLLKELIKIKGFDIDGNHIDCGELIYNIDEEEYQGGSGAGCSALVFNSYIYKMLVLKKYRRILFVPTGALLSTTSSQQGETIPGIAHVLEVES